AEGMTELLSVDPLPDHPLPDQSNHRIGLNLWMGSLHLDESTSTQGHAHQASGSSSLIDQPTLPKKAAPNSASDQWTEPKPSPCSISTL
ncbi:MAG: hypothetical protein WBE58_17980, partial [Verrucomicrobiales bacterium]